MRTRGRHSAAEKAAPVVIAGTFGQRPEPPAELSERQGELWREIVACEDPGFFATAALKALLADYCRHREAIEKINDIVNNFDPDWLVRDDGLARYQTLLRIRDTETRASSALATKLRLTNQARYTPKVAARVAGNALQDLKPWEM